MRGNSVVFLGWLMLGLMVFTIPELPILVPSAAGIAITGPTPWRPYGPYAKQVQVSVFFNSGQELQAFQQGQLDWYDSNLRPADVPGLLANPDAAVSDPDFGSSVFQVDINHHVPLFGIAQQQVRTDFTTIRDGGIGGLPASTMEPTVAGRLTAKAIAHLIDKSSFVNTGACAGLCAPIDDQESYFACVYGASGPVAPCTTFPQRAAWDSLFSTTTLCATSPANPCAYRLAAGSGGLPSAADKAAAISYLQAAGLTLDPATGKLSFPSSGPIIFAIIRDDPRRLLAGTIVADALDSIFDLGPMGQPVTLRLIGGIRQIGRIVFLSSGANSWNLYTGAWSEGIDDPLGHQLYDSALATDFCGGQSSLFNLNYGYYCNPAFNLPARTAGFLATTVIAFKSDTQQAANVLGNDAATIPLFGRSFQTLAHNGWAGLVNTNNLGLEGVWNWVNMRQKPNYCTTSPHCTFLGPPGGGNPDLLRAGFSFGTNTLNIFQSGSLSEARILDQIYDTPGHLNPRTLGNPSLQVPYEALVTQVGEVFCTAGVSCPTALGQPGFTVPGVPASEPVTVIQLTFRNDIQFHDGVQLTAKDYLATVLAYRDVCQGVCDDGLLGVSFGNLLSWSLPIPGTNTGNLGVQLVFDGQSFLNKLNAFGAPILPLHVWDTDGDGFICSDLGIGSCAGRVADFVGTISVFPVISDIGITFPPGTSCNAVASGFSTIDRGNAAALAAGCIEVTGLNFDPVASGFLIGSGPFQCLDLDTGKPGGSCSRTAYGVKGGQSIGPGWSLLLTRFDGYLYCCPDDPNGGTTSATTPLGRFAAADLVHTAPSDWKIDVLDLSAAVATNDPRLISTVVGQLGNTLGGTQGRTLNEVDLTNTGNAYTIGY